MLPRNHLDVTLDRISLPSLGFMSYTRTFNRFEFKYVLPDMQAREFVDGLQDLLEPDPHVGDEGAYWIESLYYDSPDLRCFWEKIDGLSVRRKLRVRRYGAKSDDNAFLEIKQRVARTVQKRRVRGDLPEILDCLTGSPRESPPSDQLNTGVLREARAFAALLDCKPQVVVGYRREAFQAVYDNDLRVTLDTQICAKPPLKDWILGMDDAAPVLPPGLVVLEVKFNDHVPLWLTQDVARFECTVDRMSKYCSAMAALYPNVAMF